MELWPIDCAAQSSSDNPSKGTLSNSSPIAASISSRCSSSSNSPISLGRPGSIHARSGQAQRQKPQPPLAAEPHERATDEHATRRRLSGPARPQLPGASSGCAAARKPAGSTRSPRRRATSGCSPKDSPGKSSYRPSHSVGKATPPLGRLATGGRIAETAACGAAGRSLHA
jgi:hypothetical protein